MPHCPRSVFTVIALGLFFIFAAPAARAQMISGENMVDYEAIFGVKIRPPKFRAGEIESSAPANVLYAGEKAKFTIQVVSESDAPIVGNFTIEILPYGTVGIPGDIWKPRVVARGQSEKISVAVNLPQKNAYQNFVIEPQTPAFGSYAIMVDLGDHGRRFATTYARTFAPEFKPPQFPQLCLDTEDPLMLTRLNAAPNRVGISYHPSDEPNFATTRERFAARLREYQEAGLPITVEFGAGRETGDALPLGRTRPHLDENDVMQETKSDFAWLPKYDADFQKYVKDFCLEFGWPKGPINGVKLWNEPWEGISIAGWGADMQRYREIYTAMARGVEEARAQGAQVLIGGCDSSANTFDKFFADGSDEMLKWLDFCAIHYQGMNTPAAIKAWRERKHPNGRVLIWDTESWVANTDDRVATVVATDLAVGYDRAVGVFHGNISSRKDFGGYDADGKSVGFKRRYFTWSVASAVGAVNHFIGPRKFRELIFENGLPYVMRFDDPAKEQLLNPGAAPAAGDNGTLVVIGDLGEAFGADNVLYRTVKSPAELEHKAELAKQITAALTAKNKAEFTKLLTDPKTGWNVREPLSGGALTLANPQNHFRLYDFYGNAIAAENGNLVVPLDHRGFYLTGDGSGGSFAALVEAVRAAKINGVAPAQFEMLDFTAPLTTNPELRVRVKNLLNREISGALQIASSGIGYAGAGAQTIKLAPNETQVIAFKVENAAIAADNLYPTQITFTGAENLTATHFENLRVNFVAKKTVTVDGKLDDWSGALPQIIAGGSATPTLTEQAWEPYRQFDTSLKNGYAVGYVAYDDDNFYFAAKIADATPEVGTSSLFRRDEDEYFYPPISYEVDRVKTLSPRVSKPHVNDVTAKFGLLAPGGGEHLNVFWEAAARRWEADLVVPAGEARLVTFFLLDDDWVTRRRVPLVFTDPAADKVLDKHAEFTQLGEGMFVTYKVSGAVRIAFEPGHEQIRATIGGIFMDPAVGAAPAGASVEFVESVPGNGGVWENKYGRAGYRLPNGAEKAFTGGVKFTPNAAFEQKTYTWPEGVRRFSYRKRPWLPQGNYNTFDNVQLAFNALPDEEKPLLKKLPGTPEKFVVYSDTDYEYALNQIAPEFGGGYEVIRLRYPGMADKHYYPRQPRSPNDGLAPGAQLAVTRDGASRFVEAALPWKEIPGVKAKLDAGEPVKFSFRVNDGGAYLCMELSRYRSVAKRNLSFKVDFTEHWANELEFGWEK